MTNSPSLVSAAASRRYLRHGLERFGITPFRPMLYFSSAFIMFICSQYLLTSAFLYNLSFYLVLLPAFLVVVWRNPTLLTQLPKTMGVISCVAFFTYVLMHAALWQYADQAVGTASSEAVHMMGFAFMVFIFGSDKATVRRLLFALVAIAFCCAILSLLNNHWQEGRFVPIGRAHNAIPAASVYAVAALVAVYLFFQADTSDRWKLLCAGCAGLVTLMAVMASRGPLLALLIGYGVMLLLLRQWKIIALLLIVIASLVGGYLYYSMHGTSFAHLGELHDLLHHHFEARNSMRIPIWEKTIDLIAQRPWQGYGLHAGFSFTGPAGTVVNPHNLYLGAAYYLGIPGLILFLIPLLAAFCTVLSTLSIGHNKLYLALLIHGVAATFTNFGQAVKTPSALWTIYWLPILLVLAVPPRKPVGQA